jgi:hypothetical protein
MILFSVALQVNYLNPHFTNMRIMSLPKSTGRYRVISSVAGINIVVNNGFG